MDIFDLIDWAIENHPDFYQVVRYLPFDALYDAIADLYERKTGVAP